MAGSRPIDIAGILVAVLLFALYLLTMCPTVYSGDAPELATAAHTFGVPHPPGYALYTLLGNLWTRLLPFGDPGWQVNVFSATAGSLACLLTYGIVRRLGVGRPGAIFATLTLGLGQTFWSQAIVSEVYAFDTLLLAAAAYGALRATQLRTTSSIAIAILCLATWVNHRNVNAAYAIGILFLLWPALRSELRPSRSWVLYTGAALAPFAAWLSLPLCAAADPLLNTGDPQTLERFWDHVSAKVYRHYLFSGDFGTQLTALLSHLPRNLGVALLAAPVGAYLLTRKTDSSPSRWTLAGLLWLVGANLFFAGNYAVSDAVIFTLPTCLGLATLAGLSLERLPTKLAPLAVLGPLALAPLNFRENNLSGQTLVREFAQDALKPLAPQALVLSHVDSVTFALWYAQAVEGHGPDDLLTISRGQAHPWHMEWAKRRRPDLDIPVILGPNAPSRWPAQLTANNLTRCPIYVTANLAGYFLPADQRTLLPLVRERPAGLLTQLHPKSEAEHPGPTIQRNREFWKSAWPHAQRARLQHLSDDMAGLVLHYASMRILFGRYCLEHGDTEAASESATAVLALDPAPLIAQINRLLETLGRRYHMSEMPREARRIIRQSKALQAGTVSLDQIRNLPKDHQIPATLREAAQQTQAGEFEEALTRVETVLLVRPRHLTGLFQRAEILTLMGRKGPAIQAFETLLRAAPTQSPLRGPAEQKLAKLRQ